MTLTVVLICAGLLLALGILAVIIGRAAAASRVIYGASIVVTSTSLAAALTHLLGAAPTENLTLPVGLPWLGAHFRLDALSAFFLAVVDFGAASASLFALGYGSHEATPGRILPFYPAFLAGMSLVVLADDAFTFLVSWEFMSLTSWALVMAHHDVPDNVRAGYVYLVMAAFGTLTLLLVFGLLAGPEGHYAFAQMRTAQPSATIGALALILALIGAGSKAGIVPLHAWLPLAHPAAPSHVSSSSALAWRSPSGRKACSSPQRSHSRPPCCTSSITPCSKACCSSAPAPSWSQPVNATWSVSAGSFTACRRRRSSF
jgi:hydrogenase-4 component B